jgi:tetratricopeptide (TPR) repeat protein
VTKYSQAIGAQAGSEREIQKRIESLLRQREVCLGKIGHLELMCLTHDTNIALRIQLDEARAELERIEQELKDASEKLEKCLEQLYIKAKQAEDRKDWSRAIELLQKILAINENYRDASQWLAEAEEQLAGLRRAKREDRPRVLIAIIVLIISSLAAVIIFSISPPFATPQVNIKSFLVTKGGNPTVVAPDSEITATVGEIITVTVEISTTGQGREENLLFSWDICSEETSPVLQTIGNPVYFYRPSKPGSDCICVAVEKGGVLLDKKEIFVDVQE